MLKRSSSPTTKGTKEEENNRRSSVYIIDKCVYKKVSVIIIQQGFALCSHIHVQTIFVQLHCTRMYLFRIMYFVEYTISFSNRKQIYHKSNWEFCLSTCQEKRLSFVNSVSFSDIIFKRELIFPTLYNCAEPNFTGERICTRAIARKSGARCSHVHHYNAH